MAENGTSGHEHSGVSGGIWSESFETSGTSCLEALEHWFPFTHGNGLGRGAPANMAERTSFFELVPSGQRQVPLIRRGPAVHSFEVVGSLIGTGSCRCRP